MCSKADKCDTIEMQRSSCCNNKRMENDFESYVVKPGDTIESIAAMFNMTPSSLCHSNKLTIRTVFVNQKLKIDKCKSINSKVTDVNSSKDDPKICLPKQCESNEKPPKSDLKLFPFHYKDNYIEVRVKYITDTEGVISGKLLLTPLDLTFIPSIKDPVVQEYGYEPFVIHVPNNKIACISMYNDSSVMAYKRSQRKECDKIISPNCHERNSDGNNISSNQMKDNEFKMWNGPNLNPISEICDPSSDKRDSSSLSDLELFASISLTSCSEIENLPHNNYLCVIASPRYKKTKVIYQKEDEYWFMIPMSSTEKVMEYMLVNAQTLYDTGANVDPECMWPNDAPDGDSGASTKKMRKNSSFVIAEKEDLTEAHDHKDKLGLIKQQSMDWEIINNDYDYGVYYDLHVYGSEFASSEIINVDMAKELLKHSPNHSVGAKWDLIYATHKHGWSLHTLYRNVFGLTRNACILILKDLDSDVILGACCNTYIRLSRSYYGDGTTFLFRWYPKFQKFQGSLKNHFIMYGDPEYFSIGASNSKNAIRINSSLYEGISQACETFDSPSLTATEFFRVSAMEVWSYY